MTNTGAYDSAYRTQTGDATRERASHFWDGVSEEQRRQHLAESYQSSTFAEVRRQLLELPMLTPEQVSLIELDRRHTIVLKDEHDKEHVPAFQFNEGLRLHDGVIIVNEELAPDYDPWGTASWWNSEHANLLLWDSQRGNYYGKPADIVAQPIAVNTLRNLITSMMTDD